MYLSGMRAIESGAINWLTADMRVQLVTNAYTFLETEDFYSEILLGKITNVNGGVGTLAGMAVTPDEASHRNLLDATDLTWVALGAGNQPFAAIIYVHNANPAAAQLICYVLLTAPPAPNGGDYKLVWDALGIITDTST
jgi:hypothetical protein